MQLVFKIINQTILSEVKKYIRDVKVEQIHTHGYKY